MHVHLLVERWRDVEKVILSKFWVVFLLTIMLFTTRIPWAWYDKWILLFILHWILRCSDSLKTFLTYSLYYRVARYVIVNNVTTTLESKTKNAWKRHWQKRNGNSLNSLYLGVSNYFKDGSSKLNNHSDMAVGKFILPLSVQFEFCFILRLFVLRFCMKMIWN